MSMLASTTIARIAFDDKDILYPNNRSELSQLIAQKELLILENYVAYESLSERLRDIIDKLAESIGIKNGLYPFARMLVERTDDEKDKLPYIVVYYKGKPICSYASLIIRKEVILTFLDRCVASVGMPIPDKVLAIEGLDLIDESEFQELMDQEIGKLNDDDANEERDYVGDLLGMNIDVPKLEPGYEGFEMDL